MWPPVCNLDSRKVQDRLRMSIGARGQVLLTNFYCPVNAHLLTDDVGRITRSHLGSSLIVNCFAKCLAASSDPDPCSLLSKSKIKILKRQLHHSTIPLRSLSSSSSRPTLNKASSVNTDTFSCLPIEGVSLRRARILVHRVDKTNILKPPNLVEATFCLGTSIDFKAPSLQASRTSF